jgi:hypothetical protein
MKLRHVILSGLASALIKSAASAATKSPNICRKLEKDIKAFIATHGVPGLAFGVIKSGHVICAKGLLPRAAHGRERESGYQFSYGVNLKSLFRSVASAIGIGWENRSRQTGCRLFAGI